MRQTSNGYLAKSSSLSPHDRFAIALHSPRALPETGLRMCPPEKRGKLSAFDPKQSGLSASHSAVIVLRFVLQARGQVWTFEPVQSAANRESYLSPQTKPADNQSPALRNSA